MSWCFLHFILKYFQYKLITRRKMTKKEFVAEIAELMNVPVRNASEFFDKFIYVLQDNLAKGEKVQLSTLGTFETVERAARESINPFTKAKTLTPAKKAIKFKSSKYLKEAINSK
ncbi:HU family DNA-binding protein [Mycoplasmopsis mucosicanis]